MLAKKCGKSRAFIQGIETASYSCSLDTLIKISNALEIPLKKFLNLEIKKKELILYEKRKR